MKFCEFLFFFITIYSSATSRYVLRALNIDANNNIVKLSINGFQLPTYHNNYYFNNHNFVDKVFCCYFLNGTIQILKLLLFMYFSR